MQYFEVWQESKDQRGKEKAVSYCIWSCTGRQMTHHKVWIRWSSFIHQSLLGPGSLEFNIFESPNLAWGDLNPGSLVSRKPPAGDLLHVLVDASHLLSIQSRTLGLNWTWKLNFILIISRSSNRTPALQVKRTLVSYVITLFFCISHLNCQL